MCIRDSADDVLGSADLSHDGFSRRPLRRGRHCSFLSTRHALVRGKTKKTRAAQKCDPGLASLRVTTLLSGLLIREINTDPSRWLQGGSPRLRAEVSRGRADGTTVLDRLGV